MELLSQYLDTIFIAKPPEQGWPEQFFIITACNPRSSGDRNSDNEAHRSLRRTLSRSGYWKHKVTGASPDWKHREKGFAVEGLDLKKAIALGREFQQNAIFAIENDVAWLVPCFDGSKHRVGQFSERLYESADEPKYRIYVIRLDDEVLNVQRFREANPDHEQGKPCYYVGMTSKTPEERFAQHKKKYKDCTVVRDHGLDLAREKYESIPRFSRADAERKEIEHAHYLRSQGYAVWQN